MIEYLEISVEEKNPLLKNGLKIGFPKSGELSECSVQYLAGIGIDVGDIGKSRRLYQTQPNRTEVYALRQADIIANLVSGNLSYGIIGSDELIEAKLSGLKLNAVESLGFGVCDFRLGFPFLGEYELPMSLMELSLTLSRGKIATSLPRVFRYLMEQVGITLYEEQLVPYSGSVEVGWMLDPDIIGVADIVGSGTTMHANFLRPDFALYRFPGAYLTKGVKND